MRFKQPEKKTAGKTAGAKGAKGTKQPEFKPWTEVRAVCEPVLVAHPLWKGRPIVDAVCAPPRQTAVRGGTLESLLSPRGASSALPPPSASLLLLLPSEPTGHLYVCLPAFAHLCIVSEWTRVSLCRDKLAEYSRARSACSDVCGCLDLYIDAHRCVWSSGGVGACIFS